MQMLAHLPQERSTHPVTPSNRKKLRRNFFKPILFETIFCAAFFTQPSRCTAASIETPALPPVKTKNGIAGRIRKSCHDLSAIATDDGGYGPHSMRAYLSCVPSVA
jgi:hypothetical protein